MDSKRVCVSGYPGYTQPQDLIQAFGNFGKVEVEKITKKYAVVLFPDEDKAKEAIQESGKIVNYGEFLTIKGFNGKPMPSTPKRNFPRSKQKETIVSPQLLELSGDFYQQLDRVLTAVRLSQQEVAALGSLYSDLQEALRTIWPGCVATPFGSITTGLGIKSSDADCFVWLGEARTKDPVGRARRVLQRDPRTFAEVLAIPNANTPIVKFFHVPTGTNCDVTFKTPLGAYNSRLVAFMLHADPRLLPLAVVVKYWAKVHGFTGSGKLTNYALTLLVLFYLQQPPTLLLPSVNSLQTERQHLVDDWNVAFDDRLELLPRSTDASSISELLGGFFQYYSTFDFKRLIVCPLLGRPIPKESFKQMLSLPPELHRYRLNVESGAAAAMKFTTSICIQDPFELCHNVASCVSSRLFEEIKAYFRFAAVAYDADRPKDCQQFLKTILLRKPKIPRSKVNTEYKAVISTSVIQSIDNPDRRKVIRDALLKMFKELCKIELSRDEGGDTMTSKKRKERYMGIVTKAIWKRKQFTKLYSVVKVGFLEKEARITEEIINVEKEQLNLKFCLTLAFTSDNHANAFVKLKEGDADNFKEFGSFFVSIMHTWFNNLLKPHLKPKLKDRKDGKEKVETEMNATLEEDVCDDEETSSTDDTTDSDTPATRDAAKEHTSVNDPVETQVPLT